MSRLLALEPEPRSLAQATNGVGHVGLGGEPAQGMVGVLDEGLFGGRTTHRDEADPDRL